MEYDPTRMCEMLVGLGDVEVLGIDDKEGAPLRVRIRRRVPRPPCGGCGGPLWSDGERPVALVDLPAFGRPVRLVWHKRRWRCPRGGCEACGCRKLCRSWSGGISVLVDESAAAGRSNDLEVPIWLVCRVGGDGW